MDQSKVTKDAVNSRKLREQDNTVVEAECKQRKRHCKVRMPQTPLTKQRPGQRGDAGLERQKIQANCSGTRQFRERGVCII